MLRLTFSNRFELLLENLLARLAGEGASPLAAQQVIVPSAAVKRRIELACAERWGICANIDFAYLAQWLWQRIGQCVDVAAETPFSPSILSWRVFEHFGDAGFVNEHARPARYLKTADPVMRLELAQRTAQLLEHYVTYRPEWLSAWSDGRRAGIGGADAADDEAWQAALWRRISTELGTRRQHPAAAFFEKIEHYGSEALLRAGLPPHASIFCLNTLPPLYLDILQQLSRWIDLRIFVLNPCREYWFEIVDSRRLGYLAAHGAEAGHEVGNVLLAAWGKQTQAHIDLLLADETESVEEDSVFLPAGGGHLLAALQNAILDLRELEPGRIALAPDDRSVEVHVCHSLTRELEVLHDQLLALFAGTDPPTPDQVAVFLPDLEAAAPLIDAVFATVPAARRIPYTLTGLRQTRVNPIARVLDSLLTLCAGRFAASAVFDLLQQAPVAASFAVSEADLVLIRDWIRRSGMRWGLDASDRERLDLPADERHSFADGLHRLFLAYALGDGPAATGCVVAGRVAAADPTGSDASVLGRFWRYVLALKELRDDWVQARPAEAWHRSLHTAVERFAGAEGDWIDHQRALLATLRELHADMQRGGSRSPLPLAVVHSALRAALDDPGRGGVPSGVLTFASLSGLRMLPYRVICLLGLNDGAFPSGGKPPEFDLMARQPRRGDRQRRFDERNLFLDLILAARQRLYLSYCGYSIRDNSPSPPSVLVAELLDYLARACASDANDSASLAAVRQRLTVEHPLQAFSAEYFVTGGDARRRSYNADYCHALQGKSAATPAPVDRAHAADDRDDDPTQTGQPFFARALPPPPPEWRQVDLEQLLRFFRNPCRTLLSKRLNMSLADGEEELQDEEPFLPDYPSRQALAHRIVAALLAGARDDDLPPLALAGHELPTGPLGARILSDELPRLREFVGTLRPQIAPAPLPTAQATLDFDIEGERWQISGAFVDLRPTGLIRYRYDDVRAADYLVGWLTHLFLCAAAIPDARPETTWHSRDGIYHLRACPPDIAREHLAELLVFYRRGLAQPLPFFPKSAWAYVAAGNNIVAARRRWLDSRDASLGESADTAYRLAWRGVSDPLNADFEHCAQRILQPLLDYLDDSRQ